MGNSYWSAGINHPVETAELIDLLTNEYGYNAEDLPVLENSFWSKFTHRASLDSLSLELSECRTTGAVNKVIYKYNSGR
eukprot:4703081-Prymnesium_polylepis.1